MLEETAHLDLLSKSTGEGFETQSLAEFSNSRNELLEKREEALKAHLAARKIRIRKRRGIRRGRCRSSHGNVHRSGKRSFTTSAGSICISSVLANASRNSKATWPRLQNKSLTARYRGRIPDWRFAQGDGSPSFVVQYFVPPGFSDAFANSAAAIDLPPGATATGADVDSDTGDIWISAEEGGAQILPPRLVHVDLFGTALETLIPDIGPAVCPRHWFRRGGNVCRRPELAH